MKTVWTFDQSSALPKGHKGVCMQLVAYWLSLMQHDKSENETTTELATLCKSEAQKLQRAYTKAGQDQSVGADEAVTWQLRKLRLKDGIYTPCATATEIVDFMDEKRKGYSMGIYFTGGGGHALGFWRSGKSKGLFSKFSGHTYFFDPNAGCYKGDTSEFKSWLASFMSNQYPKTRKIEMAKVEKQQEARKHWQGAGAFRYG
jgi:hypothetical protein